MSNSLSRALLRSSSLIILISSPVLSSYASASEPFEVVVTAERSEVPLKNTGSSITVISSAEIEKYGSKNIADILRTVAGLTLAESGGLGGETKVSLRGASPGASMILLDGVRISDPSNTEGYFDFGNFSAANIERIEILRGPQSALYGSDAMGGVVNIITKKGKRTPVREVTLEGGSYGTLSARGSMSGATDTVSYSLGVNTLHSDGFARYGYRVNRPLYGYDYLGERWAFPALPKSDPVNKYGVNGRVTYRINPDASFETGLSYFSNTMQIDNPYAYAPENVYSSYNQSDTSLVNGYVKGTFSAFDGHLKNQITAFANRTDLAIRQREGCFNPDYTTFDCLVRYRGNRAGVEYQGDQNLNAFGFLTFGLRNETEFSDASQDPDYVDDSFTARSSHQTTNSVFVQHRYAFTDRFDASWAARVDAIESGKTFGTWRLTGAYRIDEIDLKLRSSIGTGAKAASLFQRFSPYGTPSLQPETSIGYDLGFDKKIMNGTGTFSVTYFNTKYENKILFVDDFFSCLSNCYYNADSVNSQGFEVSIDAELVPSVWHAKFGYTYTDSFDVKNDRQLLRVPKNQAFASLVYSGIPKWEFEPRVVLVDDRLDTIGSIVKIPGYARFDLDNRYKFNASNDAYIRFENLTDAHTEDVYNYGSAGRSVYVGWTTRW